MLGAGLGILGLIVSLMVHSDVGWQTFVVLPVTLLLVVIAGTLTGCTLPLLFKRLGWDPALMSNPFVTVIIDILGIVIYMNVALLILGAPA